jgi:flotillin
LRQLELVPQIAPVLAQALSQAKLINISSDGRGAAGSATDQITGVIQTVLAAQLVTGALKPDPEVKEAPRTASTPEPAPMLSQTANVVAPVSSATPKIVLPKKPPTQV